MHHIRIAPALIGAALLFSGAAHAQTATTTTRHYDCTKPGNANKAACKGAAAAGTPAATPAAVIKTTTTRNYDCSKAGNANKTACKNAAAAPAAPAPTPSPVAASATRTTAVHTQQTSRTTTTASTNTNPAGPNGATAQCKDGTYSHSAHRSGTCAGHKGVQTWY